MSERCACGNVRLLPWQDHKRDAEGRCHARRTCFMVGHYVTDGEAEAEVERLTAALAERDRRIEAAMEVCDQRRPDGTPFLTVWTKEVVRALGVSPDE